jgi:hypothetical protein
MPNSTYSLTAATPSGSSVGRDFADSSNIDTHTHTKIHIYFFLIYAPRERSRYSDSLRARRSQDRIPVGGKNFRTRPDRPWGPPTLLYNRYRVSFPDVKRTGRGVNHPPPSSAVVKERVELYLYFMACSRVNVICYILCIYFCVLPPLGRSY